MKSFRPTIERTQCLPGGGQRVALTGAVLETSPASTDDGRPAFIPTRLVSEFGAVHVTGPDTVIRLVAARGTLQLSARGVRLPGAAKIMPYTRETLQAVGQLFSTDRTLQDSVPLLARDLTFGVFEYAAASGLPPAPELGVSAVQSSEAARAYSTVPVQSCTTVALESTIIDQVWGWVNHVVTAGEQYEACVAGCPPLTSSPFSWPAHAVCAAGCLARTFVDIVSATWKLISSVARTVVTYVTTCVEVFPDRSGQFKTPYGAGSANQVISPAVFAQGATPPSPKPLDPGAVQGLFASFLPMLRCLAEGEWSIAGVDLPFDVLGVKQIPYGVTICVGKDCLEQIEATVSLGFARDLYDLVSALFAEKGVPAVLEAVATMPAISFGVSKLAAVLGVSVTVIAAGLLAFLIELAYQSLALVGQIKVRRWLFGQDFANGACFHHPTFVLAGVGAIANPLAAVGLASLTPIIVTSR